MGTGTGTGTGTVASQYTGLDAAVACVNAFDAAHAVGSVESGGAHAPSLGGSCGCGDGGGVGGDGGVLTGGTSGTSASGRPPPPSCFFDGVLGFSQVDGCLLYFDSYVALQD